MIINFKKKSSWCLTPCPHGVTHTNGSTDPKYGCITMVDSNTCRNCIHYKGRDDDAKCIDCDFPMKGSVVFFDVEHGKCLTQCPFWFTPFYRYTFGERNVKVDSDTCRNCQFYGGQGGNLGEIICNFQTEKSEEKEMLTKETLESWRRDALKSFDQELYTNECAGLATKAKGLEGRILALTQELLDYRLMEEKDSVYQL